MRKGVPQRYRVMPSVCTWIVCDSKQANRIVKSFALRREAREYAQELNEQRHMPSNQGTIDTVQLKT